jgi:hypothetical protein
VGVGGFHLPWGWIRARSSGSGAQLPEVVPAPAGEGPVGLHPAVVGVQRASTDPATVPAGAVEIATPASPVGGAAARPTPGATAISTARAAKRATSTPPPRDAGNTPCCSGHARAREVLPRSRPRVFADLSSRSSSVGVGGDYGLPKRALSVGPIGIIGEAVHGDGGSPSGA